MDNSNLIQRAKQGDPVAIAQLINRQLNARGIQAEVVADWDGLSITLRGQTHAPDQASSVAYLRSAFQKLQAATIYTIQVKGSHMGTSEPVWSDIIVLASRAEEPAFGDLSDPGLPDETQPDRDDSIVSPSPERTQSASENEQAVGSYADLYADDHPDIDAHSDYAPDDADNVYLEDAESESSRSHGLNPLDSASEFTAPAYYFNPVGFRLGWLALNLPLVWLFHLLPRLLYRHDLDLALTSPLRPWDIYPWIIMVPIAIGQWLLLRRHLSKAYWWAIALIVLFYLEELIGSEALLLIELRRFGDSEWLSLLPNLVRGLIFGFLVGLPQWLLLRRSLGHAVQTGHWIWISAIAWMMGLGLPIVTFVWVANVLGVISLSALYPLMRLIEEIAEGIGPLLYALITGIVLARWIRIARTTAPS